MNVNLNINTGSLTQQLKATNDYINRVKALAGGAGATQSFGGATQSLGSSTAVLKALQAGLGGATKQIKHTPPPPPWAWQNMIPQMGSGWQGRLAYGLARAMGFNKFGSLLSTLLSSSMTPLTAVIAAVVGAFVILKTVIQSTFKILQTWRDIYWKSGARSGGAASVNAIAHALGMSPESVASKAGGFPGGSPQFLQQIKALLSIKNDIAAFHMARALGLSDYLGLRDLSKSQQAAVLSGSGFGSTAADRQAAAQFQYSWGSFMQEFNKLMVTIGLPYLKAATVAFRAFNKVVQFFIRMIESSTLYKIIKLIYDKLEGASQKNKESAEKFEDSVDSFTRAVGEFGGIQQGRSGKAFPPAWTWYGAQQAMMNDATKLGAFTL